jgi:hypothetical protein
MSLEINRQDLLVHPLRNMPVSTLKMHPKHILDLGHTERYVVTVERQLSIRHKVSPWFGGSNSQDTPSVFLHTLQDITV